MNNWIEIKDGEDVMLVNHDRLTQVGLVGNLVQCLYQGPLNVDTRFDSPAAARAAYDSLLAQLRGQSDTVIPVSQEQPNEKLDSLWKDLLKAMRDAIPCPKDCLCLKCAKSPARDEAVRQEMYKVPPFVRAYKAVGRSVDIAHGGKLNQFPEGTTSLREAAEMLWVVLANVSEGDWGKQTQDWQDAAAHWRDNYFRAMENERPHKTGCLCPRCTPKPPFNEPFHGLPVSQAPHMDGCPCEECAAKRQHVTECEAEPMDISEIGIAGNPPTPPKDYVEPSKPWPQQPLHRMTTEEREAALKLVPKAEPVQPAAVPSEEELVTMLAQAHAESKYSLQPEKSLRRQLLARQPQSDPLQHRECHCAQCEHQRQVPAGSVVPGEIEFRQMVGKSLDEAKGKVMFVCTVADTLRRQLLERQPKREELSEEQIECMFNAADTEGIRCNDYKNGFIGSVLRQLREAGRLL